MQHFAKELTEELYTRYKKVQEHIGTIDALLSRYAIGWDLNRMGKAEINILRLAVFEILFDEDIPEKVAEASHQKGSRFAYRRSGDGTD